MEQQTNEPSTSAKLLAEKSELLKKLEAICKASQIKTDSIKENNHLASLIIYVPLGGETQKLRLSSISAAKLLINNSFEKFQCITGYNAIWSRELRTIEAALVMNDIEFLVSHVDNAEV